MKAIDQAGKVWILITGPFPRVTEPEACSSLGAANPVLTPDRRRGDIVVAEQGCNREHPRFTSDGIVPGSERPCSRRSKPPCALCDREHSLSAICTGHEHHRGRLTIRAQRAGPAIAAQVKLGPCVMTDHGGITCRRVPDAHGGVCSLQRVRQRKSSSVLGLSDALFLRPQGVLATAKVHAGDLRSEPKKRLALFALEGKLGGTAGA